MSSDLSGRLWKSVKTRDRLLFIAIGLIGIVAGFAKAHQAGPFGHLDFRGQPSPSRGSDWTWNPFFAVGLRPEIVDN